MNPILGTADAVGELRFAWKDIGLFRSQDLEQAPCHMPGVLPADYFGLADLNAALTASASAELPFTIGMHGRIPKTAEYCSEYYNPIKHTRSSAIDVAKVERLLRAGANLKIQRFAQVSPKIAALVSDVQQWLGCMTSANGYLSFGLQRGLPLHWDSHDVLAVQLIGRKQWKIYPPTVDLASVDHRAEEVPPPDTRNPTLTLCLQAGDALYLPRGWWHDVTPVPGVRTLHAAIGVHLPTRADFLVWAVEHLALHNAVLRRSVPESFDAGTIQTLTQTLLNGVQQPEVLALFWKQYREGIRPLRGFEIPE